MTWPMMPANKFAPKYITVLHALIDFVTTCKQLRVYKRLENPHVELPESSIMLFLWRNFPDYREGEMKIRLGVSFWGGWNEFAKTHDIDWVDMGYAMSSGREEMVLLYLHKEVAWARSWLP